MRGASAMKYLALVLLVAAAWGQSPKYGVGRAPTAEEVKAWAITVFPDGRGLPEGSGTAAEGKDVYERRCQRCHGSEGKGGDEPPIVGGKGTIATPKPLKTVGSYWPYATTLFDYIRRAMPFKDPGMLTANQTYAVSAYILQQNGLIGANEAMNAKTLPQVKMPNKDGFIADPRPDTGKGAKK
ncbi:MAG: cytochrome c [Acidobacteria bacterium]|nr:cytochrome c [Acidobacteriota bacterium]